MLVLSLRLSGFLLLVLFFVVLFHIREAEVTGNDHYTDAEIRETVLEGVFQKNAIFLWLLNRERKVPGNTFIDTVSVDLTSPWSVRIRITEKQLAGYIPAKDEYWYFDASGVARVSSPESELELLSKVRGQSFENGYFVTEDGFLDIGDEILRPNHYNDGGNYIPFVKGVEVSEPVLGEPLNDKLTSSFKIVAVVKNYIDKCSFRPDSVEITPEGRIWLHIGEVVVDLGSDGQVEVRLRELEGIYPKLAGRRGTLHLENYDGTQNRVIFSAEPEEEAAEETGSLPEAVPESPAENPGAAEGAPAEAPAETPAETPVEAPVETPAETPAETPVEAPVETPAETPAETPVEAPVETPVEAPAEAAAPAETPAETPADTPAEAPAA